MRYIWESKWFFVPVAFFLGISAVLLAQVPYSQEILFFNAYRHEPLNTLFLWATHLGEFWAFLFFGIACLFWKPRYSMLIALLGLILIPLVFFLKDKAGVDRPATYFEKRSEFSQLVLIPDNVLNKGQTSFPSGHTMSAFALYSLLALMAGKKHEQWGLLFAILAILTGISRIFLIQHFLTDVVGGALAGLLISAFLWWLARRYHWLSPRAKNKQP